MKTIKELEKIAGIYEAKKPANGNITLDIDFVPPENYNHKNLERQAKVKIKLTGNSTADISGKKKDVYNYLTNPDLYSMDKSDVESIYPSLFESINESTDLAVFKGTTPDGKATNVQITRYASKTGLGIQITTGTKYIELTPESITKLAKELMKVSKDINK